MTVQRRFLVYSPYEVPLAVMASDPWHALRLGLELLGRERMLSRALFEHQAGGAAATDPRTGERVSAELSERRAHAA